MKAHLLAYSQACAPQQVQRLLNDTQAVETWVTPFPYAAILVSRLDVNDLAAVLRDRLPGVWFMVTELRSDAVQGWLPKELWEYVNSPSDAWSRQLVLGYRVGRKKSTKGCAGTAATCRYVKYGAQER